MRTRLRILIMALAVSAMALACGATARAQTSWEMGFKGGVGFANLSGSGLGDTQPIFEPDGFGGTLQGTVTLGLGDMKTGFIGGGYAFARVNPSFGVRIEALYANKGTRGDNSGTINWYDAGNNLVGTFDVGGENKFKLDYFEIPLLAVWSIPSGPTGAFEVFAGPSLSFVSSAKIESEMSLTGMGGSQSASDTQDIKDQVSSTDFGGVLGVGYAHRTTSMILSLDLRWTQGFTKVDDTGSQDWKNQNLSIMAGIGFPLGGAKK